MKQFFVYPRDVRDGYLWIRGPEAHHIKDVFRYNPGDNLAVFDGQGRFFKGEIEEIKTKEIKLKILSSEYKNRNSPFIRLAQAVPKKRKMDFIVEKATELGAAEIIPMLTERTIPRPSKEKEKTLIARWMKIAIEAAKQSKQLFLPRIEQIKSFSQVLESIPSGSVSLIPCLGKKNLSLRELDWDRFKGSIFVFIGPEGDFTEEEVAQAGRREAIPVSLGNNVLKSETAAIYLLSILNYSLPR